MFDTDARDLTFLNLEGVKINNRQLFWIAAGIIAILLLLIGAYALIGTNNNTTATPTPTPTATPLPQGQGTGIGQGSEAPTVTPTPTAAPTAAPTPAPQPTMGVLTYNSTWPLYDFHWVAGTGTNTIGPSSVGFNDDLANLYYSGEYYYYVLHEFPEGGRYIDIETDSSAVFITIQLNRTGDLSGSYSVPVTISDGIAAHIEILDVQPASFAAGQSTANMTIAIDRAFLDDMGYDEFTVTISPSANYDIWEEAGEFQQEINVG